MRVVGNGTRLACLLILAACSGGQGGPLTTTTAAPPDTAGIEDGPIWTTPLPGAVAANVAAVTSDGPRVAWIGTGEVMTARVDVASGELMDVVDVNGDVDPITHPIERPSVLTTGEDGFEVAFTSFREGGASVFRSVDGSEPVPISGQPMHETNLVHVTSGPDGAPVYAWLEMSTLSVGIDRGDGLVETDMIDDLTCDCCNPAPILVGPSLAIAYRDFETIDGSIARDVVAIRSEDGGATYGARVLIADDHWFIDGCPFSGPSAVQVDGTMVVAWMDARQSLHPDQQATTIWADRSDDGGMTYGPDIAVSDEGVHSWPVMAVGDEGTIHLVWETQGTGGGLSYASSTDQGRSFTEPVLLVARSEEDSGAPRSPSVAHHEGMLIVTWADPLQGHVAAWDLG